MMTTNTKQATVVWAGGMKFEGAAGAGHTVFMDSVAEGPGEGFSPMELLLVGMAGCTAMDVISILQKKRQSVDGLEVNVRGERASEHPKVYTDIHMEYVVRGDGIAPEAVQRAVELSTTKYCSATAMMAKTAKVSTSYRIEGKSEE